MFPNHSELFMLKDKSILIISPQAWGKMFISKHHYAIELAKAGNKVYFLSPPNDAHESADDVSISPLHQQNLYLITHKLYFPYNLRFHVRWLFHLLMRWQVKKILSTIGQKIDILWSFDLNNIYPLAYFGANTYKIFHPVDEPLNNNAILSGNGADIIFSVTNEILEKYEHLKVEKHFINHGVADYFLMPGDTRQPGNEIRVGFSGNLLRKDLDRKVFLQIIKENPQVIFECWGSYAFNQSNIGGVEDEETKNFIGALQKLSNVILHGAVASTELAKAIHRMDAFLICYDIKKDQSKGTNYHKIMEYLSTGKIIISNNVTTYRNQPQLLQMGQSRENNDELPGLFSNIISHINDYNSLEMQQKRISFGAVNTYSKQIEKIGKILSEQK
jgi:glycosyltransferase involved in cell wall biosynthesis